MDTYTITDSSHLTNSYAISQILDSNRAFCFDITTKVNLLKEIHNAMTIQRIGFNSVYIGSLLDIRQLELKHTLPIQSRRITILKKSDIENSISGDYYTQEINGSVLYIYLADGKRFNLLLDDTDSVMGKLDYEY